MTVEVWTVGEFLTHVRNHARAEFPPERFAEEGVEWLKAVLAVGQRAHARGDGVAVYENVDLGHPEIGQWQIASYGGPDAQLETREDYGQSAEELSTPDYFTHGEDTLRTTLPDIGGRINWRYTLKAIVPSYEQDAKANEFGTPGYSAVPPALQLEDDSLDPSRYEPGDDDEEQTYRIVRFYRDDRPKEVINTGFTLEQAQAHCNDEKTHGEAWFDGYEVES